MGPRRSFAQKGGMRPILDLVLLPELVSWQGTPTFNRLTRPRSAEQLPQRDDVKDKREGHKERRHQCQRKARHHLRSGCRVEDLCRTRIRHDPKPNGDDQIGDTEQIPGDRSPAAPRRVELSRNPRGRRCDKDVSNASGKRPECRHLALHHQNQEDYAFKSPQVKANEIGLPGKQATQRTRSSQGYGQDEQYDSEIDSYGWNALCRRWLERPASRKDSRRDGPYRQRASAG